MSSYGSETDSLHSTTLCLLYPESGHLKPRRLGEYGKGGISVWQTFVTIVAAIFRRQNGSSKRHPGSLGRHEPTHGPESLEASGTMIRGNCLALEQFSANQVISLPLSVRFSFQSVR